MAPSAIQSSDPSPREFTDPDDLRTTFSLAMSAMYKKEVPLYGDLIKIVRSVNEQVLRDSTDPKITAMRNGDVASERLDLERHGAIRLGTPHELQTVRRIFAIIGLYPVGYYDLTPAGLPMHATCFRPLDSAALKRNPFRVFTTLLRPNLFTSQKEKILADSFVQFPDTWEELRRQGLVYFEYRVGVSAKKTVILTGSSVDDLVHRAVLTAVPLTYEDFLPLSAAGIFQSNLGTGMTCNEQQTVAHPDQPGFEAALGCAVTEIDTAYALAQDASLRKCAAELGMSEDKFV